MDTPPIVRPRRSLAFPFFVTLYPLLWLVNREAGINRLGQPVTDHLPFVLALVGTAMIVSYAVAVVVDSVLLPDAHAVPAWIRTLVAPSRGTLVLIGSVTVALVAYFAASSVGLGFPSWLAPTERGVGLVLGWPMMASTLSMYFVSNTVTGLEIPFAAELFVVTLGVAFTAVWLFLLSSGISTVASRVLSGAET